MEPDKWVDIVLSFSFGTASVLLFKLYLKNRSLLELYFSLAALAITIPYLFDLFLPQSPRLLFHWGKLVAITIYISGLLVLIRESKPVFARFPLYLTALPFISFLFFPLIIDSIVIKDLINAVYQGGALVVTVLVFTVNNARRERRRYYIIGLAMVSAAYLGYWLYFGRANRPDLIWISEILLAGGILVMLFRFIKGKNFLNNS
ncbi:MAG TPA: hypothetical protein VFM80_08950 [Gracilimonas sp.]|uniref:hypothetical protein n=1 Tax=Gracilimonas sp. TaxID=1974203 RepID=UPI002DB27FF2|nr:hypothetical protein [Gracilimonas sp.]